MDDSWGCDEDAPRRNGMDDSRGCDEDAPRRNGMDDSWGCDEDPPRRNGEDDSWECEEDASRRNGMDDSCGCDEDDRTNRIGADTVRGPLRRAPAASSACAVSMWPFLNAHKSAVQPAYTNRIINPQ
jgi:hypothetical protein